MPGQGKLSAKIKDTNETLTTERDNLRQMQKEILEARDHARKADQHKTEFVNNMSHEIRTPLNAIVECAHLIVDNVDESKQQYLKRYAKTIDVSADMLNAIVTDVLEIATSDNSEVLIQKKPASVNAIGNFVVESMRKHCKDGVEMTYVNANDPDTSITTDARRVEQVLINLLSNAAKFTDEGHIHLSYWLDPESTLTFAVEDTGCGIPGRKRGDNLQPLRETELSCPRHRSRSQHMPHHGKTARWHCTRRHLIHGSRCKIPVHHSAVNKSPTHLLF